MPAEPCHAPAVQASNAVVQGLRLSDVAHIIFPEHELLKHLKHELYLAKQSMFKRFWHDNDPQSLVREMVAFNRVNQVCKCAACKDPSGEVWIIDRHRYCKLWNRIVWLMGYSGLTFTYPNESEGPDKHYLSGPGFKALYLDRVNMGTLILPDTAWPPVKFDHTPTPNFDSSKACEFLSPVSDLDAHIVFVKRGNVYEFEYGRKLWDQPRVPNDEIDKLDMFRVRIRIF